MIGHLAATAGELLAILEALPAGVPVVEYDRRELVEVEVWETETGPVVRLRFGRRLRPSYPPTSRRRP